MRFPAFRFIQTKTSRGSRLAHLPADPLARVANPLALVGLGRAQRAHVRGELTDQLPVDALDANPSILEVPCQPV